MPSFARKGAYNYWLVILITGVSIACLGMVLTHTTFMIGNKITKLHISLISLHSASSVRIPSSVNNFRDMLPTIRLSPLGPLIIRKYTKPFNAFKRRGMYPNVFKWNANRCVCCTHLCTKTTITSSVNGRRFSIINTSDMGWTSSHLIYVITLTEINCGMQFAGQTGRSLKTRLCEHFLKIKKPKKLKHFFIAISEVIFIHLVKFNSACWKKIYIWSEFIY